MKIKLIIAFVTLILLFTSSLSWAQDIAPFSLITVTPKSSDNQNIKYSVTFTNTARKIHLEVPAIYSTDEINASTPPFAKNLDNVSFTIKLKRINTTGVASYTTIGKYKYVIPVINNPGAYSKALVDFSNQVGFTIPTIDFSVLPQNDLLLSDLYAKNFLEQITGSVINEADLKYDSSSYSSSSSYQVVSASGAVTYYKSSKGIGNFIPQFIKDFDLKGFVNNKTNIMKKVGVLASLVPITVGVATIAATIPISVGVVSSLVAIGVWEGLFIDASFNRINQNNPTVVTTEDKDIADTADILSNTELPHFNSNQFENIQKSVENLQNKISTAFINKTQSVYDSGNALVNSLNSTDFDDSKIQNALIPPTVVCTAPQVRDATTNTCVTPAVVCTAPQVRDATTNTCFIPAVVCTAPQVRDATTNTCITPAVVCTAPQVLVNNVCTTPSNTGKDAKSCIVLGINKDQNSQTMKNQCNQEIAVDWCNSGNSQIGMKSTACNYDSDGYFQQFSVLKPGELYWNRFSLPLDTKIFYGACFGSYGAIKQTTNGNYVCK